MQLQYPYAQKRVPRASGDKPAAIDEMNNAI
ncbi:hypothetical protein SEET535_15295 [Salmonella enterica subsp. enterica serovar Tennessee str. 4535]|nr:hypothetical protein SEET535_15295 [Salmonella enterica subsp. enterica serovar Tennessee str. 4535]ESF34596.1 hypothetical protein SEET0821_08238 [Salmonella enterica subsp. enterica serovar Tennessee str. TXSC_TXSC08-21]